MIQSSPDKDRELARELVLRYGWNSVAYQIVNPGFRYWFSPARDAVVGYVSCSGYRVVGGGPVCAENQLPEITAAFEADTAAARAHVIYFGAGLRLYEGSRHPPAHSAVALGAQPAWTPGHWAEITTRHSSLRAQFNRARNKGVEVIEWAPNHAERSPELQRVLDAWLATRPMPPMHFLVEPQTLADLRDRRVFVAERRASTSTPAAHAEVVGFLIATPVPARRGWLFEQIVRSPVAPNGTNELLVDTAVRAFARDNAEYVTLGLSPLSRRSDAAKTAADQNPPWLRLVMAWVRAHGRRFYNFEGLDAFKSKFQPEEWEPIFALANQRRFRLRALYAVAAAFSDRHSPMSQVTRALRRAAQQEWRWFKHEK